MKIRVFTVVCYIIYLIYISLVILLSHYWQNQTQSAREGQSIEFCKQFSNFPCSEACPIWVFLLHWFSPTFTEKDSTGMCDYTQNKLMQAINRSCPILPLHIFKPLEKNNASRCTSPPYNRQPFCKWKLMIMSPFYCVAHPL